MDTSIGQLFVISAPSGAGKTSLVKALLGQLQHLEVSVSHTTRAPRAGEVNGKDYHFVDQESFLAMAKNGAFYEHAQVFDHYYGTAESSVRSRLAMGNDVILEIDWQGARQIRKLAPDAHSLFILPPSRAELENRLRGRGQDDDAIIQRRMRDAQQEMSHYGEFDFLIVNDVFEQALEELRSLIIGQRHLLSIQSKRHQQLISDLLA